MQRHIAPHDRPPHQILTYPCQDHAHFPEEVPETRSCRLRVWLLEDSLGKTQNERRSRKERRSVMMRMMKFPKTLSSGIFLYHRVPHKSDPRYPGRVTILPRRHHFPALQSLQQSHLRRLRYTTETHHQMCLVGAYPRNHRHHKLHGQTHILRWTQTPGSLRKH